MKCVAVGYIWNETFLTARVVRHAYRHKAAQVGQPPAVAINISRSRASSTLINENVAPIRGLGAGDDGGW